MPLNRNLFRMCSLLLATSTVALNAINCLVKWQSRSKTNWATFWPLLIGFSLFCFEEKLKLCNKIPPFLLCLKTSRESLLAKKKFRENKIFVDESKLFKHRHESGQTWLTLQTRFCSYKKLSGQSKMSCRVAWSIKPFKFEINCRGSEAQWVEGPSKGPGSVQVYWNDVGTNPSATAKGGWKKIIARHLTHNNAYAQN